MTTSDVDEDSHFEAYTASWMLWPASSKHSMSLQRSVDAAFAGYSFYHESEWAKFGYRPPDSLSLLGAWRDSEGSVFAFLMATKNRGNASTDRPVLLYVSGAMEAVEAIGRKVTALKTVLAKSERNDIKVRNAEDRIRLEKKSPAVARLLTFVSLFTVLVNAFSLYLRKLPIPSLPSPSMQEAYRVLIAVVHLSALALFLVIIFIGIFYIIRYGVLMLRRF